MSNANDSLSITWVLHLLNWVTFPLLSGVKNGRDFAIATTRLIYQLSLKPVFKLCHAFFWSPATILLRSMTKLALLPTNVPLMFFYNTTLGEISKVNVHLTYITVILCIQYLITMMFIGILFGVWCGVVLGVLHRLVRIPDKRVDLFGGLTHWLFPHTAHEADRTKVTPVSWQHGQGFTPSPNISPETRVNQSHRRVSRSSRGSVSNLASKLPRDFFQMKAPKTPLRSGNFKFDSSRLSPMSNDLDDATASMSSNMWDTTEELPETLRTEFTARGATFPRPSYASGLEQPNYTHLKPLDRKEHRTNV
ncbi:LAME_0E10176g1_1 [Lachancea meyersii CBS 8951]|uniref:LAME_0E10176g1_1 n=1 Tax=Lachancea meyersii CBS 8951 TaxID=1266667 RepID=A0A1G4JJX1_9SACH|nr:LAME_0E10176g1_1 [Lachancea meyersii CBS 8951]